MLLGGTVYRHCRRRCARTPSFVATASLRHYLSNLGAPLCNNAFTHRADGGNVETRAGLNLPREPRFADSRLLSRWLVASACRQLVTGCLCVCITATYRTTHLEKLMRMLVFFVLVSLICLQIFELTASMSVSARFITLLKSCCFSWRIDTHLPWLEGKLQTP